MGLATADQNVARPPLEHSESVVLHPAVQNFKDFIEERPRFRMYFNQMWEYAEHPDFPGHTDIHGYEHMFKVLNDYIQMTPVYSPALSVLGSAGLPFSDMFFYAVLTSSGYAAFTDPNVTAEFKKLLEAWSSYLSTPASASGLDCWLSESNGSLSSLVNAANAPLKTAMSFEELFVCNSGEKHYGFKSWDDYFTRQFRPGRRPVCDDADEVANACESKPLSLARDVKLEDSFWLKDTAYSLRDIFQDDYLAEHFEGGTVYQGFLDQFSYHRWHAPVSGTIRDAYRIDGTYFAVPKFTSDTRPQDGEILEVARCQGSLTAISSRAIVTIEADNVAFGLVAFVAVGLHEVSTVEVVVSPGQHVEKGQQTGMFHYGGSTHCLIFERSISLGDFPSTKGCLSNIAVNARLARALSLR